MNGSQASKPSKTTQKMREVRRITPEDMPVFYANSVDIAFSPFDLVLAIGTVEEASKELLSIRQAAKIIMSPQHAKVFSAVLSQKVAAYEKQFGPLPDLTGPAE